MEEFSSNQQVRPGDATQLMNVIFSSDEEMIAFYLTLNRLVNPESNLVERSDQRKLEDLYYLLHNNITAFEAIGSYKTINVKEAIKGFGMLMMNTAISNSHRLLSADAVGNLINCIMNTTKNSCQFKRMSRTNHLHPENIKYLLDRMKVDTGEEKASDVSSLSLSKLD